MLFSTDSTVTRTDDFLSFEAVSNNDVCCEIVEFVVKIDEAKLYLHGDYNTEITFEKPDEKISLYGWGKHDCESACHVVRNYTFGSGEVETDVIGFVSETTHETIVRFANMG